MFDESLIIRWVEIIERSQLFDEEYYLGTYLDVKESGVDPVRHYVKNGVREGRNPSKVFNTKEYIKSNPELFKMKSNPLVHFIMRKYPEVYAQVLGLDERFKSKSKVILEKESNLIKIIRDGVFFDTEFYLNQFDFEEDNVFPDLISHFYEEGSKAYKNPIQWFDIQTYISNRKDVLESGFNPYLHFLEYGYKENKEFSSLIELSEARSILANSENKWVYFDNLAKLLRTQNNERVQRKEEQVKYPITIDDEALKYPITIDDEVLKGRIESCDNGSIRGWVVEKVHSDNIIDIAVSINDKYSFIAKNNKKRLDLKAKGISKEGIGGFQLDIGGQLTAKDKVKVTSLLNIESIVGTENLKEKNSKSDIVDSSSHLKVNHNYLNANSLKLNIESFDKSHVKGWMVSLNDKSLIFDFDLYINEVFFCKVKNNLTRPDLRRHSLSSGLGGFRIDLPNGDFIFNKGVTKISAHGHSNEMIFEYSVFKEKNKIENSFKTYLSPVGETAVIVPIYNAYEDVLNCIERLESYTPRGTEVLLINDASSDDRIRPLLENIKSEKLNFKVIHNSENLGFTKTVNKGIELCSNKNVVLLNSDARVTPRWLEGMTDAAITDSNIATVTAMSDRAGAFSAPNIGNNNDLPEGIKEEDYAVAFRRCSASIYPTVPTGNGFCMFIRRACIDAIGSLDAEAFPRGYGEENDFCMRARKNGWRNIIDDRTYVFHDRSKSFGGEKAKLIEAGRKVIDERYPDYGKAIQFYSQSSIMNIIRYRARTALMEVTNKNFRPRVLYVISTLTGGTPQTNRDLMLSLYDAVEPWLLHCDSKNITLYKVGVTEDEVVEQYSLRELVEPYTHRSSEYDRVVKDWLCRYDFTMAHIRHLAWHSLNLPKIIKSCGTKVLMSFHDYYVASHTVKLIDPYNDASSRNHKLAPLWMEYETPNFHKAWELQWREMFAEALSYCDGYITTSESAKETILSYFTLDMSKPFLVINHGRDFKSFRKPNYNIELNEVIKVLIPGNIDKNKGLDIIYKLLDLDKDNKIQIHLLGKCSEVIESDKVINHGAYNRDDFVDIVANINPHISAVFSVWNETWCHTLTESWASGLPVVVFDFPTVANRVEKTRAGWVADSKDIQGLYNNIIHNYTEPNQYASVASNVEQWQLGIGLLNNNRYMSIQYLNLYKSILNVIDIPSELDFKVRVVTDNFIESRIISKYKNSLYNPLSYLYLSEKEVMAGVKLKEIDKAAIDGGFLENESS